MYYLIVLFLAVLAVYLYLLKNKGSKPNRAVSKQVLPDKAYYEAVLARDKIHQNMEQIEEDDAVDINLHLDEMPTELSKLNLLNWSTQLREREDLNQLIQNIKRPKSLFNDLLNSSYDPKEYATLLASDPIDLVYSTYVR